jgi:hypothetical protein
MEDSQCCSKQCEAGMCTPYRCNYLPSLDMCAFDHVCIDGLCYPAPPVCSSDAGCGAGEICCAGACRQLECCGVDADPNTRCREGTTCVEGVCAGIDCAGAGDTCTADGECCGDLACVSGVCNQSETRPPTDTTEGGVIQLPDTGIGGDGDTPDALLGITLAAGVATLIAGKRVRTSREPNLE